MMERTLKRGDDEEVRMKIGRFDTPGDKDFEEELGRLRIEIRGLGHSEAERLLNSFSSLCSL